MMKKLVILYLVVLSVLSVASSVALRLFWPELYPAMLYTIPLFYILMLGVMFLLKNIVEKKGRDRSIFFLSYRVVKILLALVFLLVYFQVIRTGLVSFAVVFMIFYACLSDVETVLFMKGEKKI